MKFVDRTQEKERLTKILNMDRPTFTAIYGKRRLGKSALITTYIPASIHNEAMLSGAWTSIAQ